MNIILNGTPTEFEKQTISYTEVVTRAGGSITRPFSTVTWRARDERSGTLTPGQVVAVTEGMIFNCVVTTSA